MVRAGSDNGVDAVSNPYRRVPTNRMLVTLASFEICLQPTIVGACQTPTSVTGYAPRDEVNRPSRRVMATP